MEQLEHDMDVIEEALEGWWGDVYDTDL